MRRCTQRTLQVGVMLLRVEGAKEPEPHAFRGDGLRQWIPTGQILRYLEMVLQI